MKQRLLTVIMCTLLALTVTACGDAKEVEQVAETVEESAVQETESIQEESVQEEIVVPEHTATYSVAVGADFEVVTPHQEGGKEFIVADDTILEMVDDTTASKKIYRAKSVGTTSILINSVQGNQYEYTINVFDQKAVLSPSYIGISAENYLDRLAEAKQKKDEVLDCDKIYFILDYYNGVNVEFGRPANFDVNLLDLIEGDAHLIIKATSVPDAEWFCCGLGTHWEECGSYLDLSKFERYFDPDQGDFEQTYILNEEMADTIREYGRLWITGHGYALHSVTIYGTPIAEYDGMTATETSPLVVNGAVHMDGTNVVNENGEVVRLLGAAFEWNQLALQYANSKTYAYFNETWGGNAVRIGEHAESEAGYASVAEGLDESYDRGNQEEIIYYIESMIDACIESGMYAVVDWHMFYNPLTYADYAVDFFDIISKKYAGVPNLIYEICNEPCDDPKTSVKEDTWANVKEYADMVIPVIRANSPDALIVCGGPKWSNDVLVRANDPLTYDNIIYTDHIYNWHDHYSEEKKAYDKGIGLLITETSVELDGKPLGGQTLKTYQKWEDIWNSNNTGFFYWGIHNEDGNSGLKKETVKRYGWTEDDYTEAGLYMYHLMRRAAGLEE